MREQLSTNDIARFAAFAAAISVATDPVSALSARLAALSNTSANTALQIANVSVTAAQMIAQGQLMTTCCQYPGFTPSETHSSRSSNVDRIQRLFVSGTAFVATLGVLLEAGKWIWTTGLPIVKKGGLAIGRAAAALWELASASDALVAAADTVGELLAAAAALAARAPLAAIGATALVGGAAYVAWRERGAITRAIRSLGAAISHEAMKLRSELSATGLDGPEDGGDEDALPGSKKAVSRSGWRRLRSIAPSTLNPVNAGLANIKPFVLSPSWYASFSPSSLSARALRGATVAMLAAPLLASPALAAIPARGTSALAVASDSVVINSSPTITINASDCRDIEQRVLEAFRKHREELYAQWCNELQRRQRTEF
jgi:hypothetical protein